MTLYLHFPVCPSHLDFTVAVVPHKRKLFFCNICPLLTASISEITILMSQFWIHNHNSQFSKPRFAIIEGKYIYQGVHSVRKVRESMEFWKTWQNIRKMSGKMVKIWSGQEKSEISWAYLFPNLFVTLFLQKFACGELLVVICDLSVFIFLAIWD